MPRKIKESKSSVLRQQTINNGFATSTVICDDSREVLKEFVGRVDLIVTSPPYAMRAINITIVFIPTSLLNGS